MRVLLDVTPVAITMLKDMRYTWVDHRVLLWSARAIKYEVDRVVYGDAFTRQVNDVFVDEFITLVGALENNTPGYAPPMDVPIESVRMNLNNNLKTLLQTAYTALAGREGIVIVNWPDPLTIAYEIVSPEVLS